MPAGAPTKLTPAVIVEVRKYLPTALYIETVATYLGISRDTYYEWLKRGGVEKARRYAGKEPEDKEDLYVEFSDVVLKGVAKGEIHDLATIKNASVAQWQAAAWRLERRFPAKWGRRDYLEFDHKVSGTINIEQKIDAAIANLSIEAVERLAGLEEDEPSAEEAVALLELKRVMEAKRNGEKGA